MRSVKSKLFSVTADDELSCKVKQIRTLTSNSTQGYKLKGKGTFRELLNLVFENFILGTTTIVLFQLFSLTYNKSKNLQKYTECWKVKTKHTSTNLRSMHDCTTILTSRHSSSHTESFTHTTHTLKKQRKKLHVTKIAQPTW